MQTFSSKSVFCFPELIVFPSFPRVTWDQALFSFRFENYIPAGKAKRKEKREPLKLGLISGYPEREDHGYFIQRVHNLDGRLPEVQALTILIFY